MEVDIINHCVCGYPTVSDWVNQAESSMEWIMRETHGPMDFRWRKKKWTEYLPHEVGRTTRWHDETLSFPISYEGKRYAVYRIGGKMRCMQVLCNQSLRYSAWRYAAVSCRFDIIQLLRWSWTVKCRNIRTKEEEEVISFQAKGPSSLDSGPTTLSSCSGLRFPRGCDGFIDWILCTLPLVVEK